jgi:two-component system LytT family response regulator
MNAIIIDDEKHCITTLVWTLKEYCPEVVICGTAQNGEEGLELIKKLKPELVFLDVEMPMLNGLDMLQRIDDFFFKVIFTTAYDKYAIKAIKLNALDYLLKPIDKDELIIAIQKVKDEATAISPGQLENLQSISKTKVVDKIALSLSTGLQFINLKDLIRVEGDGNYCNFILFDNRKILLSKKLGDAEELLADNSDFFRVHKSHIINLKYVERYIRGEGGEIIMFDGANIALSRTKKEEFLELFNKL